MTRYQYLPKAKVVFFFNCCDGWEYIVTFTKVLTIYQIYHNWTHLHHHSSLSSSHSWNSFNRSHFSFTFMCTQYLHHIHLPSPFPHLLPLPSVPTPPPQAGPILPSFSLILYKKKKKKKLFFCLFEIATQGVFLWHFHVYMYYSTICFISSIILLFTLVPFLLLFQLV
jgi:hypothetical protein